MLDGMPRTFRELVRTLERLGAVTPSEAAASLAEADSWVDEEFHADDLISLFDELPIAFYVEAKVDSLESAYHDLLQEAAGCSRGAVTIDDVEMVDVEGEPFLHFRRNGRPLWWRLEHRSPFYVDLLTIAENLDDLAPSDGRAIYHVEDEDNPASDGWYILLTPEQARVVREEFDLPLEMDWAYTGQPEPSLSAAPGTAAWYVEESRARMDEPSRLRLDEWLAGTESALQRWRADDLDFTLNSLSALETRLLERFPGPGSVSADDEFVDGAARYIGETVMRAWPSHWFYRHSGGGPAHLVNVPVVRANTPAGFAGLCVPVRAIERLVTKREPGTLLDSVNKVGEAVDLYQKALLARTR